MDAIPQAMTQLIAHIESAKQIAKSEGLDDVAQLLEIAWIGATVRAHNITNEELDAFFFALESEVRVEMHIAPPECYAVKANGTSD